ncbi:hypothetical protein H0O01_01410 [Candidatus Micrarchaeota archaeon]|nr:hypothetical protein [Candidatus Micrarchaeota archaeon]
MKKMLVLALFGLLIGASFAANCAADAYRKSCASCSFDANGKMDRSCSDGFRSSGISCTSTSYPIMSGKYAAGQCTQVDECASELSSCVAQYATGDERADCQEGSVAVCYSAADECTKKAAITCGEVQSPCGAPSFILIGMLALAGFAYYRKN